ncbi:MAG: type VI secretion system contractile sheath small subunit [Candidatus Algichlamydia australiensis]|nr:type VI secretion system contractile sheath small subunit [Chlamydiales bacterium]
MSVQDEVKKSRITLRYRTTINGEPKGVNLPLRLLVLGNFSNGTSRDRKKDLDERSLRSINGDNFDHHMKEMNISLNMVVDNKLSAHGGELRVKLPIDSMKSFNPQKIAERVPEIRSLLLLKRFLEEMQSNVANKKEFAQLLNRLYSDPESFANLRNKLQKYEKDYTISIKEEKVEEKK